MECNSCIFLDHEQKKATSRKENDSFKWWIYEKNWEYVESNTGTAKPLKLNTDKTKKRQNNVSKRNEMGSARY